MASEQDKTADMADEQAGEYRHGYEDGHYDGFASGKREGAEAERANLEVCKPTMVKLIGLGLDGDVERLRRYAELPHLAQAPLFK